MTCSRRTQRPRWTPRALIKMAHRPLNLPVLVNIPTAKRNTYAPNAIGGSRGTTSYLSTRLRLLTRAHRRPSGLATHMNSHTGERRERY